MEPWDIMHVPVEYIRKKAGKDNMKEVDKYVENVKIWYSCFPI